MRLPRRHTAWTCMGLNLSNISKKQRYYFMNFSATFCSVLWRRIAGTRAAMITVACIACLCLSGLATARETHGAHVHGVANLTMAFAGGALEMQFESPAMSILGFEHSPKNQSQLDKVNASKELLESPNKVFAIDGAKCELEQASVEVKGPAGEALEHDDGHDHAGHKERHSELSAIYTYYCDGDQALNSVKVLLFEHFSALDRINVNWVTDTQQGQLVLQSSSPVIEFP